MAFCYNSVYNQAASPKDKLISLGRIVSRLNADSLLFPRTLKTIYNNNLISALWSGMISGQTTFYSVSGGKKLSPKQFKEGDIEGTNSIAIPVYDSLGNLKGTRYAGPEITAESFKHLELIQNWYYDATKDIIICKIPEAYLYINSMDEKHAGKALIRIVF